jgi:uncharacterized delta-60 repeat protein
MWQIAPSQVSRFFQRVTQAVKPNTTRRARRAERRFVAELMEERAVLSAGDLDLSYGLLGKQTANFDLGQANLDQVTAAAVDAQGRLVVVGSVQQSTTGDVDFGIARFTASGALDLTFNGTGKQTVTFSAASSTSIDTPTDVKIQADGKIVVAGSARIGSSDDFAVARLNANGSLDTTFDTDGMATVAVDLGGTNNDHAASVDLQSDGKLIVYGDAADVSTQALAVVRLNTNGSLDTTFASDASGRRIIRFGSTDTAGQVVVQSDDKIVLGATGDFSGDDDMAVIRLTANGQLDKSFAAGGIASLAIDLNGAANDDVSRGIAVQANGKIVVVGQASDGTLNHLALVRLNANGALDTTFGIQGKTVLSSSIVNAANVVVQANGLILVGGTINVGGSAGQEFVVYRFTANGKTDFSFNGTGRIITGLNAGGTNVDAAAALAYRNGALYIVGTVTGSTDDNFGVVKIQTGLGLNSVIGFNAATGQILGGISNGTQLVNRILATFTAGATFVDYATVDLNGDGHVDVIARNKTTGQWSAAINDGEGNFTVSTYKTWNASTKWTDTLFGDVNDDGRADVVTRDQVTGKIYVALSTGTSWGAAVQWSAWASGTNWTDVQLADMNGDGRLDLIGRNTTNGQWNVALSNGTSFSNSVWATWAVRSYADVIAADFTGDGRADLSLRDQNTGKVYVAASLGTSLGSTRLWATWSTSATWTDVVAVDINNDSRADLFARNGAQLYVDLSTGTSFNHTLWGTLPSASDLYSFTGDFNGDGFIDVATRNNVGQWFIAANNGSSFNTATQWGVWSTSVGWQNVASAMV